MCGVVGFAGGEDAFELFLLGLRGLQHRGQDSVGIAGFLGDDYELLKVEKSLGLISKFIEDGHAEKLRGSKLLMGHTRYATRNLADSSRQIHPHWAQSLSGRCAIVTNGDILNVSALKSRLNSQGVKLYTENDGEIIAALVNSAVVFDGISIDQAIERVLPDLQGGTAGLMMFEGVNELFAFTDLHSIRPLFVGNAQIGDRSLNFVASESCVFGIARRYLEGKYGAELVKVTHRALSPGEILSISPEKGITVYRAGDRSEKRSCVFEAVYFSRPDSAEVKFSYQRVRERMGELLWKADPIEADAVVAVPKGGVPAAVGYSRISNIPFMPSILEEPAVGGSRTFITDAITRSSLVHLKYVLVDDDMADKRIVLIDDSLVRGTTMKYLVKELFARGAREVHLRIASPPYQFSCNYGIETADPRSLIYFHKGIEEVRQEIGATSLQFLEVDAMLSAMEFSPESYCTECFTGISPLVELPRRVTLWNERAVVAASH